MQRAEEERRDASATYHILQIVATSLEDLHGAEV